MSYKVSPLRVLIQTWESPGRRYLDPFLVVNKVTTASFDQLEALMNQVAKVENLKSKGSFKGEVLLLSDTAPKGGILDVQKVAEAIYFLTERVCPRIGTQRIAYASDPKNFVVQLIMISKEPKSQKVDEFLSAPEPEIDSFCLSAKVSLFLRNETAKFVTAVKEAEAESELSEGKVLLYSDSTEPTYFDHRCHPPMRFSFLTTERLAKDVRDFALEVLQRRYGRIVFQEEPKTESLEQTAVAAEIEEEERKSNELTAF